MPVRIGINGFGRIGRIVVRIGAHDPELEFVGVNDLVPADMAALDLTHHRGDGRPGRHRIWRPSADCTSATASSAVAFRSTRCSARRSTSSRSAAPSTSESRKRPDPVGPTYAAQAAIRAEASSR